MIKTIRSIHFLILVAVISVFSGIKDLKTLANIITRTFPLHPITLYALPRLSARVSQNERTLFHFLLGPGENCLYDLLKKKNGSKKGLDLINNVVADVDWQFAGRTTDCKIGSISKPEGIIIFDFEPVVIPASKSLVARRD